MVDTMSRVQSIKMPLCTDFKELAKDQKSDDNLQYILSDKKFLDYRLSLWKKGFEIYYDVSGCTIRPYITLSFRKLVFDSLHGLSHPGVKGRSLNSITLHLEVIEEGYERMG